MAVVEPSATTSGWPWRLRPPPSATPPTRLPRGRIWSWLNTCGRMGFRCRCRNCGAFSPPWISAWNGCAAGSTVATIPSSGSGSETCAACTSTRRSERWCCRWTRRTSIQAKERRHPDQSCAPGRPRRREFEYIRHGTAGLVAALDVHSGSVAARPIERNNSTTFCAFLDSIDAEVDATLVIHVILDNGSSHVSKETKAWFAAHPRWVVHYTPPHASWVNQIELFFSILQRKVLRNGSFDSREDLIAKLLSFISDYDQTAKPFAWTYSANPLKVA